MDTIVSGDDKVFPRDKAGCLRNKKRRGASGRKRGRDEWKRARPWAKERVSSRLLLLPLLLILLLPMPLLLLLFLLLLLLPLLHSTSYRTITRCPDTVWSDTDLQETGPAHKKDYYTKFMGRIKRPKDYYVQRE